MSAINHEVLMQFTSKGLTINEGIAIDARLVQSASHPLSTEKLEETKAKSETPQGKVDKNGKELKFSHDLESDWIRYISEEYFGLSHLYNKAYQARFPKLIKNALDALFRQMAFNLFRASKILKTA